MLLAVISWCVALLLWAIYANIEEDEMKKRHKAEQQLVEWKHDLEE